ncbi:MAG TPA: 23S rRNA (pseudouridine(1915)-N(3))-methyltransferase RlmH [Candidatus Faecisoma merdavium]|nr:23S rRNA (pseudouridine(1915)-N(3))-methyltransferase RlmH [Candidatus Faecisoma merdavium]
MIRIICVGKLKEKYLVDACLEYTKRISKYSKIEIIELKDSNIKEEKDNILKYINKDYIITLEIEGDMVDSPTLAKKIDNIFLNNSNITFIIGGSDGLHDDIKKISNYKLSFSKLTFPHQLFRVMLLEQIYRSFKILNNETYHK